MTSKALTCLAEPSSPGNRSIRAWASLDIDECASAGVGQFDRNGYARGDFWYYAA